MRRATRSVSLRIDACVAIILVSMGSNAWMAHGLVQRPSDEEWLESVPTVLLEREMLRREKLRDALQHQLVNAKDIFYKYTNDTAPNCNLAG